MLCGRRPKSWLSDHNGSSLETKKMRNAIFKGQEAPDFALSDLKGKQIRLSDFRENKVVVLALLRGFM